MEVWFGGPSLVPAKSSLLFRLHLTMNVPNFVPNTAINDIFHGSWEHKCISRLNVSAVPTTSRVPFRGRAVAYPTTLEMVQWVYSSAAIRDDQVGFLRNLSELKVLCLLAVLQRISEVD
jgi:hypothetical protein